MKRMMYGRAKFPLLHQRVLHALQKGVSFDQKDCPPMENIVSPGVIYFFIEEDEMV